jgi:hypothetical protein
LSVLRLFLLVGAIVASDVVSARADQPCAAAPSARSETEHAPSRPQGAALGAQGPKRRMRIGLYVNAVREVDWSAQNFLVDFYWWIRYPCPASDEERSRLEALEFVNGNLGMAQEAKAQMLEHETQEWKMVRGENGPERYVSFRTIGRFYFQANFAKYPFDRQQLPIIIEHEVLTADELEMVDDEQSYRRASAPNHQWGLAPSMRVPGLTITGATRRFESSGYDTNFGDPDIEGTTSFARATFTIEVARSYWPYLFKILVPLGIILILAYLVFFVPARELEVAVGLTVTSVLASIAFQLTVADDLPNIGYLVTSDLIFYLCYFLIMTAMVETVYTHNLEKKGRKELADAIERLARYLYPGLLIVGVALIIAWGALAQ